MSFHKLFLRCFGPLRLHMYILANGESTPSPPSQLECGDEIDEYSFCIGFRLFDS